MRKQKSSKPIAELFWPKVKKSAPGGCWEWAGTTDDKGYGRLSGKRNGKWAMLAAHRVSYALECGPIPRGMFVCHHCDNRICVNPAHLFLGTAADNNRDMTEKGRRIAGETHPTSKLDWTKVKEIRASDLPHPILARKYGVSQPTISQVKANIVWKVG